MTNKKAIGRIFFNENCLSGYIIIGINTVIRFACEKQNSGSTFLYPSKKDEKEETKE